MNRNRYSINRYKLILNLTIVATIIISFLAEYSNKHTNLYYYTIPFLVVLNEVIFLKEEDLLHNKEVKDKGILSAIIIAFFYSYSLYMASKHNLSSSELLTSMLLILIGAFLRSASKIFLGRYFSNSIRIENNHKIIKDKIFKYIRHPAYTGTLLIILGFSLMMDINISIYIFFLCFLMTMRRIDIEEHMLIKKFGNEYISYMHKTWKLFPFII